MSLIYAVGCCICAVFGVLHLFKIEAVKGYWMIFALFPPCLVYSLVQWRNQNAQHALQAKASKED